MGLPWEHKLPKICDDGIVVVEEGKPTCAQFVYDEAMLERIYPFLNYVIVAHTVISCLYDLAVIKWRWLANFYIYFEWIAVIVVSMVPNL